MSYDINLVEIVTERIDGDFVGTYTRNCRTEHFEYGGTYPLGGTGEADFNITYNYHLHYRRTLDNELGIRWLYGKTGAETAPALRKAIDALGTERAEDYWAATPGNAGYALTFLLKAAEHNPHGVWTGD